MKAVVLPLIVASALAAVSVSQCRGQEWAANIAPTRSAIHFAAPLERGARAVTAYLNACVDGDRPLLQSTLTDDATIELPLAAPGTFFVIDSPNAIDFCDSSATSGHVTSLRMYAAGEQALFASFSQGGETTRLVLFELRGSRISRLRDFTADGEQLKRYAAQPQHKHKDPS